MTSLEELLHNNPPEEPEDIDFLLEVADTARDLICDKQYSGMIRLINFTIEKNCFEAFSWVMAILQEEFGKEENRGLEDFTCFVGQSVENYSEFINRLQVDFSAIDNEVEPALDHNGEVQSFCNILTYKTKYENIFLVTAENFDTKDNDFIQYHLRFARDPGKN